MSAPVKLRSEDVVQAALAKADFEWQELFGLPALWSEAAQMEYRRDQLTARQIATRWKDVA